MCHRLSFQYFSFKHRAKWTKKSLGPS